ncbi:hypothetical protein DXG03_005064 [Asterophora parasitica]|uniref:Uncharacterized protein n=1 Tax=Asterophora parasitica TaxID=117018 RepID=A0A9P7G8B1_9AGAR|nr:hypothetical protein DXG03_005064 [Asterophora parasitica]
MSSKLLTETFQTVTLFKLLAIACLSLGYFTWSSVPRWRDLGTNSSKQAYVDLKNHCAHTFPIGASEYLRRHEALANVLLKLNASAYIAEPGASAAFYGNLSTTNWRLSERPLLLIITAFGQSGESSKARANVSVLTPKFESARAKALPIPSADQVQYVEWPEDANPYAVAVEALSNKAGTIFVDSGIRKFIADGLQAALPNAKILSAPQEIAQLRERKSSAEINLLTCANEVLLASFR